MSKYNWEALPVEKVLKNVELVFKTRDSEKLSKASYDVLYLMSGFIAHYDRGGFQDHYRQTSDLARDILNSMDAQDPERYVRDEYFPNEYGMEYCQSKTDVYKGLKSLAESYIEELVQADTDDTRETELAYASSIMEKYAT